MAEQRLYHKVANKILELIDSGVNSALAALRFVKLRFLCKPKGDLKLR